MKKQLLSAMTLACLMTVQALPAYGAVMEASEAPKDAAVGTPSALDLSAATLQAKAILGIDSAIWDDFSYDSYDNGDGLRWTLNWRQSANPQTYLSAVIDQRGVIRGYNYYQPVEDSGLAAIRQIQAKQAADAFLACR